MRDELLAAFHAAGIFLAEEDAKVEAYRPNYVLVTSTMRVRVTNPEVWGWTVAGIQRGEYEVRYIPEDVVEVIRAHPPAPPALFP